MPAIRLQKAIAASGAASRRGAEELILAGRVAVDGEKVTTLGTKVNPARQVVTIDGKPLAKPENFQYWMLHKPKGVVTTVKDIHARKTVLDLLPPEADARLFPVGRLDKDSEGLVLLTNDGDLANRVMHPRHHAPKHYRVWIIGRPTSQTLDKLQKGVELEDGTVTAPARVYVKAASPDRSKLSIVLYEGKKRQIRRMCEAVGHPVLRLIRVGLGPLRLGKLEPGWSRRLTVPELRALKESLR